MSVRLPSLALLTGTLLVTASCRLLLDGDELELAGGGGSGAGASTTATGAGPGTGGATGSTGTETTTSTGQGGDTTTTTTTTSSTTSSSTGPGCGDGELQGGEECDDGGTTAGDGCDADCRYEGKTCASPIQFSIAKGETVHFVTSTVDGDLPNPQSACGLGRSRFIEIIPSASGFLSVWLPGSETDFVSVLALGDVCNMHSLCVVGYPGLTGRENGVIPVTAGVSAWIRVGGRDDVTGTFGFEATLDAGTCDDPIELHVEEGNGTYTYLDLPGNGADLQGSCGGSGSDIVFRATGVGIANADVEFDPWIDDFDAALYARSECSVTEPPAACSNQAGFATETLNVDLSQPKFIIGDSVGSAADFRLEFTGYP